MNEPKSKPEKSGQGSFSAQVGMNATRRLRAQRHKPGSVWTGFAFFGLIGWSVVVPTLIGAAIGLWLDRHHPGERSWTLALSLPGSCSAALARGAGWTKSIAKSNANMTMTNMSDALDYLLAFVAGFGLGLAFFAGLW